MANPLTHKTRCYEKHNEIEYYNDIIKYNYEVAIYIILKVLFMIYFRIYRKTI